MTVIEYCREKTEVGELVIIREGGWVTCAAYIDYGTMQVASCHVEASERPAALEHAGGSYSRR